MLLAIMGGVLLVIAGGLVALAVPSFIHFGARSKQGECRSNLKGAYTASRAFFSEKDTYSTSLAELGFEPERGNRYAYFLADPVGPATLQDRSTWPAKPLAPTDVGVGVDTYKLPATKPIARGVLATTFLGEPLGISGKCPADCSITIACAGNIDNDPTLDVWSISTRNRVAPDGSGVPAGTPFCEADDTRD